MSLEVYRLLYLIALIAFLTGGYFLFEEGSKNKLIGGSLWVLVALIIYTIRTN